MSDKQLPAVITVVRETRTFADFEWLVPGVDDDQAKWVAWNEAIDAWLDAKRRKSGSDHTVIAYKKDFRQFFRWFGQMPWMVSSRDADNWVRSLEDSGLKHSSINRKLAALSSFYEFVSTKFTFIGRDNVERSIYIDDHGNPRINPFKRPSRFKLESYGHSEPLSVEAVRDAFKAINNQTLLGSRDYALLVTYIFTGRRSHEIAALRWGDIEEDRNGHVFYDWTGKGGKGRKDELPAPAFHAIVNFLKVTGRHETIKPGDYIFRPVFTDRSSRLPNVNHEVGENHPISGSMVNRIVKRRFVAVGIDPDKVHTHTLRHTAAHLRWRDGKGEDLMAISKFLNHSSVAVTQIYLSKQHKPIDTGWHDVEQLVLL